MKGLLIGRFQPFHKGHLAIVKRMAEECDSIIIGIGSAQKELEFHNPLSGGERIEMVDRVMKAEGFSEYEIYPVPDIDCYPAWPHYVRTILPPFDAVYARSNTVARLFRELRVNVIEVEGINRDVWKGVEIRRRIKENENWKDLVPEEVKNFLEEIDMKSRLKPAYGKKGETEKEVAHLLTLNESTIAIAESCTGGLISHRLTNVPGSSSYFIAGLVTYSNQSKIDLLGVKERTLDEKGAVSKDVAEEMANGIRKKFCTTLGLASTGIAGPGGGSEEKKVGTVYIGLSTKHGTEVRRFHFPGNRWEVKDQTSEAALDLVKEVLDKN